MWKSYGIIILFAFAFWLARIYSMTPYWDGTDGNGHLANIFLHNIHGPDYLINAQAEGKRVYAFPSHPAPLYEIPRLIGLMLTPVLDLEDSDPVRCAISIKLVSAVAQFMFFSVLLWLALVRNGVQPELRHLHALTVIAIAISPLALTASNEFQTDTFSGTILIGGAVFFLLASSSSAHHSRARYLCLALAGFFLGCGKNEWSMAFFMAVFAVFALGLLRRGAGICLHAGILASGLVWGNIISCGIDPKNFCGGWLLIYDMVTAHSALGAPRHFHLLGSLAQVLPYSITLYILMAFACFCALLNKKYLTAESLMLFFSASAIFSGYALSNWVIVARYFYPCLLLLLGLFHVGARAVGAKGSLQRGMAVVLAAVLASNLWYDPTLFLHASQLRKWHGEHGALVLQPLKDHEAYLLDICFLLPKVDKDFVHPWVGEPTISNNTNAIHRELKFDGIQEYPPYTTLPSALGNQTISAP